MIGAWFRVVGMPKSRACDTVFIVAAGRFRRESIYRGPTAAATLIAEAIDVIEYREVSALISTGTCRAEASA